MSGEFWLDARVRALPEDGRWAFLYLLTHPAMTAVGAMRATLPGLAAELGWSVSRLQRALASAIAQGMVEVNAGASYVGLPKFLKHNPPESLNVVRAWVKALGFVPDCPEKQGLIVRCREYLRAREKAGELKQGFAEVFAQALAQGKTEVFALQSAIPETGTGGTTPETGDTSPEQELEQPPHSPPGGALAPDGFTAFWAAYPKKVGKDAAQRAWAKRRVGPTLAAQIMAGLERQHAWLLREGGKYIPNPATWLNQGRWQDEPPPLPLLSDKTAGNIDALRSFVEGMTGKP